MNATTAKRKLKPADLAIRIGLVVLYFLLLALVYTRGRTHTLLLDNKELDGGRLPAFEDVLVSVNGAEPIELYAEDRDLVTLKGQSHRIVLESAADGKKIEKRITLPIGEDMLLLSLPKLAAGEEGAIEVFVPLDAAPPAEDEALPEELGATEMPAEPAPGAAPSEAPPAQ